MKRIQYAPNPDQFDFQAYREYLGANPDVNRALDNTNPARVDLAGFALRRLSEDSGAILARAAELRRKCPENGHSRK